MRFPLIASLFLLFLSEPVLFFADTSSPSLPPPIHFPDLPFRFVDGMRFSIRTYQGKIVLINIFSSTCKPCLEELPYLNNLAKKGAGYPFQLIGLCADIKDPEKLKAFLSQKQILFSVAYSPDGNPFSSLAIRGFPTSFILDSSGRIIRRLEGPRRWDSLEWWELLLSLFPPR